MRSDLIEHLQQNEARNETRLTESLSLLGEISKKINIIAAECSKNDSIPKSEKLILQCLINNNGETQLDIVKFTGFKAPTVSILMKKMENEGLISRKPDEYDLRAMRVFITDKGKTAYNNAVLEVKSLEQRILSNVTEEEKLALTKILYKIKSNLDQ